MKRIARMTGLILVFPALLSACSTSQTTFMMQGDAEPDRDGEVLFVADQDSESPEKELIESADTPAEAESESDSNPTPDGDADFPLPLDGDVDAEGENERAEFTDTAESVEFTQGEGALVLDRMPPLDMEGGTWRYALMNMNEWSIDSASYILATSRLNLPEDRNGLLVTRDAGLDVPSNPANSQLKPASQILIRSGEIALTKDRYCYSANAHYTCDYESFRYNPPLVILRWPLRIGDAWRQVVNYSTGTSPIKTVVSEVRVERLETVDVLTGPISAVKLKLSRSEDGQAPTYSEMWWSGEIGLVQEISDEGSFGLAEYRFTDGRAHRIEDGDQAEVEAQQAPDRPVSPVQTSEETLSVRPSYDRIGDKWIYENLENSGSALARFKEVETASVYTTSTGRRVALSNIFLEPDLSGSSRNNWWHGLVGYVVENKRLLLYMEGSIVYSPPIPNLILPARKGDSWQVATTAYGLPFPLWTQTYTQSQSESSSNPIAMFFSFEVLGFEDVTVKAGSFRCAKLRVMTKYPNYPENNNEHLEWWADGVGLVKSSDRELISHSSGE